MKIQCNCGAKYAFDVTPEMAGNPIKFVCPECGLDSSATVNSLIAQQFGGSAASVPPRPAAVPVAVAQPKAVVARLATPARPAPSADITETAASPAPCPKHPHEVSVDKCRVCGKPICPSCMALFGYVCSPHCRAKATSQGLNVPVYAGQKSVLEARKWRIIGWSAGLTAGTLALVLGGWFYYVWFGCTPKVALSVRFPDVSYSGHAVFAGQRDDQVVFLHGGTLARHDLKSKKKIWSVELLDRNRIADEVRRDLNQISERNRRLADQGFTQLPRGLSTEELEAARARAAAEALQLSVHGQNIWVFSPENIARFDWNTGKKDKEFAVRSGDVIPRGDEVFILDVFSDPPGITSINLLTGTSQEAQLPAGLGEAGQGPAAANLGTSGSRTWLPAGLLGGSGYRPLDPARVADQVQALPIQAKLALPALLAARMNQERLVAELNDVPPAELFLPAKQASSTPPPVLIPTRDGILGMSIRLIESRIVERSAMKAPPAKSALNATTKASESLEVANELLNEMQRNRGGDKVREDLSRYQVTISSLGTKDSWSGEVTGPPRLMALKSVNVLVSSKCITVFDKSQKKLWQSTLGFDVPLGGGNIDLENESPNSNTGPCIERKDSLYVFDQGVLSAFDLKTGNVRWRLPTVGINAVFLDDRDMLYVNTTSASHERIKYSRQIDVSQVPGAVILKVDSKAGKILWRNQSAGWVSHMAGKYVFAVSSYAVPEDEEALIGTSFHTGFEQRPFLKIRRINPKNGKLIWEHFEQRAPLDLEFQKNFIRLVFRKEVEILKFSSL